jgi:myo-inositol-1(or 4)-monophosphatase
VTEDERLLEVAREATLRGGEVILGADHGARPAEEKGAGDYVTEIDRRSEETIRRHLEAGAPGIPLIGEESGGTPTDRYWSVDPLDGTTNFLHGLPMIGVSVALVAGGRPALGVVHGPFLNTTWSAIRGKGAHRNGRPIHVAARPTPRAVVGTGFPFRRKDLLPRYLRGLTAALQRFEDLRRPGAAALDLAWVAEGALDGFFELALGPWDVAAGALLIQEAGGVVTDWEGGEGWLGGDILAGSAEVHAALLEIARDPAT